MNSMEEWSYDMGEEDEPYYGPFIIEEDALDAIEYEQIHRHILPPHTVGFFFDIHGNIRLRCTYCGETLLMWKKPEQEED